MAVDIVHNGLGAVGGRRGRTGAGLLPSHVDEHQDLKQLGGGEDIASVGSRVFYSLFQYPGHEKQPLLVLGGQRHQIAYARFSVKAGQQIGVRSAVLLNEIRADMDDQPGEFFASGVNGFMNLVGGKKDQTAGGQVVALVLHEILDVPIDQEVDFMAVVHVELHIAGLDAGGEIAAERLRGVSVVISAHNILHLNTQSTHVFNQFTQTNGLKISI